VTLLKTHDSAATADKPRPARGSVEPDVNPAGPRLSVSPATRSPPARDRGTARRFVFGLQLSYAVPPSGPSHMRAGMPLG